MANLFRQEPVGAAGPALLAIGGQGPVLLFNGDNFHTVWLCDDPNDLQPGDTTTAIPLLPQGTMGFDGSGDVWGQCTAGQAAKVSIIPGGTAAAAPTPAQASVPIATGTEMFPGGLVTSTRGPYTVGQLSYELAVSAQQPTGGNATIVTAALVWTDSASGLILAEKSYEFVAGLTPNAHQLKIQGPAHADTVTLTFAYNNIGGGGVATVSWTLVGSARTFRRDVFRTTVYAQTGFTSGGALVPYGVLGNMAPSVGIGGTASRLLGAYNGECYLTANTASGTNDAVVTVFEASTGIGPLLANYTTFYQAVTDARGNLNAPIVLPGTQAVVQLTNNNAAAKVISCTVLIDESGE